MVNSHIIPFIQACLLRLLAVSFTVAFESAVCQSEYIIFLTDILLPTKKLNPNYI